jgi:hypothetical protein
MKRLIRKAVTTQEEVITLSLNHYTSAQHFIKIFDNGEISPAAVTGNVSGGGNVKHYYLAGENEEGPDIYQYTVGDLEAIMSSSNIVVDQALVDYVENALGHDDGEEWPVKIKEAKPSGNQNGVYLTEDEDDSRTYALSAVDNSPDNSIPNFGIRLLIDVTSDRLLPDLDDSDVDPSSDIPEWEQTLNDVGQVVYEGAIPVSLIKGVIISSREAQDNGGKFGGYKMKLIKWAFKMVRFDEIINPQDAYVELQQLFQEYANYQN